MSGGLGRGGEGDPKGMIRSNCWRGFTDTKVALFLSSLPLPFPHTSCAWAWLISETPGCSVQGPFLPVQLRPCLILQTDAEKEEAHGSAFAPMMMALPSAGSQFRNLPPLMREFRGSIKKVWRGQWVTDGMGLGRAGPGCHPIRVSRRGGQGREGKGAAVAVRGRGLTNGGSLDSLIGPVKKHHLHLCGHKAFVQGLLLLLWRPCADRQLHTYIPPPSPFPLPRPVRRGGGPISHR